MADFSTVEDLADCLVNAHREGRPIIPVIGSGISADSGFPVLRSIVRYLGKLRIVINHRLWLRTDEPPPSISGLGMTQRDPLGKLAGHYGTRPWEFVRDFGWPERFQLNEDVTALIPPTSGMTINDPGSMNDFIQRGLDDFLKESSTKWRMKLLADHRAAVLSELQKFRDDEIRPLVQQLKSSGAPPLSKPLDELERKLEAIGSRLEQQLTRDADGKSVAMDLVGDWKRLILDFTNFQGDYADALLARFARDHDPNLAHRYLAFLIRRLNIPVIFTMNFDPFIEQALQEEDLRPRTFAMEHGLSLPHQSLVREQLAVIKMHGSTHALLLDEQLDRPLSRDYLEHFESIVGKDPLLLVLGCSGDDVRLLDLVRQTVERVEQRKRHEVAVVWLHFEPTKPEPAEKISQRLIHFRRTKHLGGTLTHIYSAIDKLHPSSHHFYQTHFAQPFLLEYASPKPIDSCLTDTWKNLARAFTTLGYSGYLLQTLTNDLSERQDRYPNPSASRQLLWMGSSLPPGYTLIWVDLESVHTLSAVAGSIIDQCRRYDTNLAPCVLPQDDDATGDQQAREAIIRRALSRVTRALRRSRYFVAFDGLETYTWSPTAHHGDTHTSIPQHGRRRLQGLVEFLLRLSKEPLSETRFAVSVDFPRTRSPIPSASSKPGSTLLSAWGEEGFDQDDVRPLVEVSLDPMFIQIADWNRTIINRPRDKWNYTLFEETFTEVEFSGMKLQAVAEWPTGVRGDEHLSQRWALALSILATFRRTRPLALVHHLLRPVLGADHVNDFVSRNQDAGIFRFIEGGGIWFWRKLRDYIYSQHTNRTSTDAMRRLLPAADGTPGSDDAGYGEAIFQLLLNSTTHQLVARGWYGGAFIQSHDTFSLLEYFYHRLASVRTLTKLIKLLELATPSSKRAREVERGRDAFQSAIQSAHNETDLLESFELDKGFLTLAVDKMLEPLRARHEEELHRLLRVWRKSESLLRAQIPAEQLLRWCKQFLEDDLKKRCHEVVVAYPLSSPPPSGAVARFSVPVDCLTRQAAPKGAITQLGEYLEDFRTKILMDRSDFEECERLRDESYRVRRQTSGNLREEIGVLLENRPSKLEAGQLRDAHHRLDVIGCKMRHAQQSKQQVADLLPVLNACEEDLRCWPTWAEPTLEEDGQPGLHELQLRGLHFLTNCLFRRVTVFSHDGFSGAPNRQADGNCAPLVGFDALERADQAILRGSRIARLLSQPLTVMPYSATLNAVVDGTLYLPYRDTFLIQQARHRWMKAMNDSALEGHRDQSKIDTLLAEVDDALREFEKARAGLSATNQLTLGLSDLYAVEACLAHARVILHENAIPTSKPKTDCFKLARSRYETARGLLGRARTALLDAQRNVIWWRFFFQLTAQYHSDRLLLGFTNLFRGEGQLGSDPAVLRLGTYVQRLRKGLESVKNATDLSLRTDPAELNWIPRLQRELALCSFALGLVAWRVCGQPFWSPGAMGPPPPTSSLDPLEQEVISYLMNPFIEMTRAAGFEKWPADQLKKSFKLIYAEIPQAQSGEFDLGTDLSLSVSKDDERAKRRQGELSKKAKSLRCRLISLADHPPQ